MKRKRGWLAALLAGSLLAFSGCQEASQLDKLSALAEWITGQGYACTYDLQARAAADIPVPIGDQSLWIPFQVEGEELLVYFDTSNRAKQLAQQFCGDAAYGTSAAFGLRFIVNYRGGDPGILALLEAMAAA